MPASEDHAGLLETGARTLGCALDAQQVAKALDFRSLLLKWNRVHNLTAIRDPGQALTHHLLDSLAVVAPLRRQLQGRPGARLLDVGSGGGLPGVMLAIAWPELRVTCVDAVAKKAGFLRQAAAELGLTNLDAVHSRVERLDAPTFDVVASRAFASLADFTRLTGRHLAADGVWMAMKGQQPGGEIAALPADIDVFHVEPLSVPGLDAERCIVWMGLKGAKPST